MSDVFPGLLNYWIAIVLMMVGFYIVIAQGNLIKKIVGLNIFQGIEKESSVFESISNTEFVFCGVRLDPIV